MLGFDGLGKSYGDHRVLDGVGLAGAPGSMVGFCGSDGAGKTTTMRVAMGLAAIAVVVRVGGRVHTGAVLRTGRGRAAPTTGG